MMTNIICAIIALYSLRIAYLALKEKYVAEQELKAARAKAEANEEEANKWFVMWDTANADLNRFRTLIDHTNQLSKADLAERQSPFSSMKVTTHGIQTTK